MLIPFQGWNCRPLSARDRGRRYHNRCGTCGSLSFRLPDKVRGRLGDRKSLPEQPDDSVNCSSLKPNFGRCRTSSISLSRGCVVKLVILPEEQ